MVDGQSVVRGIVPVEVHVKLHAVPRCQVRVAGPGACGRLVTSRWRLPCLHSDVEELAVGGEHRLGRPIGVVLKRAVQQGRLSFFPDRVVELAVQVRPCRGPAAVEHRLGRLAPWVREPLFALGTGPPRVPRVGVALGNVEPLGLARLPLALDSRQGESDGRLGEQIGPGLLEQVPQRQGTLPSIAALVPPQPLQSTSAGSFSPSLRSFG